MHTHGSFNRAYRLVWDDRTGSWAVVPETARGRGKRAGRALTAAAALLLGAALAQAQGAPPTTALPTDRKSVV